MELFIEGNKNNQRNKLLYCRMSTPDSVYRCILMCFFAYSCNYIFFLQTSQGHLMTPKFFLSLSNPEGNHFAAYLYHSLQLLTTYHEMALGDCDFFWTPTLDIQFSWLQSCGVEHHLNLVGIIGAQKQDSSCCFEIIISIWCHVPLTLADDQTWTTLLFWDFTSMDLNIRLIYVNGYCCVKC